MKPGSTQFLTPAMPDLMEEWRFFFDVLSIQEGEKILHFESGYGDVERYLSLLYPSVERVVGIDFDSEKIAASEDKINPQVDKITYIMNHEDKLPFENESFEKTICYDASVWKNRFSHLLDELFRVTKPGGSVLIASSDLGTQVFNVYQSELNTQILSAYIENTPDSRFGRKIYGLCRKSAFHSIELGVFTLQNHKYIENAYSFQMAEHIYRFLLEKKLIKKEDLDLWIADLKAVFLKGEYFYSINRNFCLCRK